MAGIVKADYGGGLPGSGRHILVPRACPCLTHANRPICVEASQKSAWTNLCPFFYGVRVKHGGMIADLRTGQEVLSWLSFGEALVREYEVLCIRKESSNDIAGAKLRD